VYYGGGDKYVALAKFPIDDFLNKLMQPENKISEV